MHQKPHRNYPEIPFQVPNTWECRLKSLSNRYVYPTKNIMEEYKGDKKGYLNVTL